MFKALSNWKDGSTIITCRSATLYTTESSMQGQYLAFIHANTLVNGRPPAEADMMRFFRVTPPVVHQMVLTLEKAGLILRRPGVARSIAVLLDRSDLPELNPGHVQPIKITVTRYSHVRHFKQHARKFYRSCLELFNVAAPG
jgi:hypothetical protein